MKNHLVRGFVSIVLALAALGSVARAQEERIVADLAFLAGAWRGASSSGATAEELISAPEGGVMVSAGREFQGGKCVFYDLGVILERDGGVVLIPHPNGKRSAHAFPLVKLEAAARRATFENRAHDFPKTFVYELVGPDRLRITLAGDQHGKAVTEIYELRRVK